MGISIHLLGRPTIRDVDGPAYAFRSQKSWGLLAYLLLSERPPSRTHVAALLFDRADDPLRALRWNLAEVRRALGAQAVLEGDPVSLRLREDAVVDVEVLARDSWQDAQSLPGLGHELLEAVAVRGAAGFESWLLIERRRVRAAQEAILHEAALGSLSTGDLGSALACAEMAADLSPLDENHVALVIRVHRLMGSPRAAQDRYAAFSRALSDELGAVPGVVVESALRDRPQAGYPPASGVSINALLESGAATVAAGAAVAGVASLRTAVQLADGTTDRGLQLSSRLVLAEALIHSVRGLDEEGIAALHVADRLAESLADRGAMAEVRTELGYVNYLRARYDRAEYWLSDALVHADGASRVTARAMTYLGSVSSDRADYGRALASLSDAVRLSQAAGDRRCEAYATSMIGRIHLLRGDVGPGRESLRASIALAEQDTWLAFLPWPQALLGEVALAEGRADEASVLLEQAFARACQLGDPCWEGVAGHGRALVAASAGDIDAAFAMLVDARSRSNRFPDAYAWLEAYILDALCMLGVRHGHPDAGQWVRTMQALAAGTGMREMVVRSLVHGAALGSPEDAAGARLIAAGIDNPMLEPLIAGSPDG